MPATREPVTKRAQMAVPLAVHTTSVSHVDSHFEACLRADLSFNLLSAGLRYEPPPPSSTLATILGRLLRVLNPSCIPFMPEVLWRPLSSP